MEILGSLLIYLGGHDSLGTNPHTQIYNLKFHPIINNNNSGTHQVGKTSLLSTNILGFKDGGEETTKETLNLHLSLCPTILILSSNRTLCNFCQGFVPPPLPPIPQQQLLQNQNASSPRPTLLSTQPVLNPNNKPPQPLHNVEMHAFPTMLLLLFHYRKFN